MPSWPDWAFYLPQLFCKEQRQKPLSPFGLKKLSALDGQWGEGVILPLHTLKHNVFQPTLCTVTTNVRFPTWLLVYTQKQCYMTLILPTPPLHPPSQIHQAGSTIGAKLESPLCIVMGPKTHGLHGDPSANQTGAVEEQGRLTGEVRGLSLRHGTSLTTEQLNHTVKTVATCLSRYPSV